MRPGGTAAFYVWDYGGKMQFMRHFWNAAASLDPRAYELDEGRHYPICNPEPLAGLFQDAGFRSVEVTPVDVDTHFTDFEDFWRPFEGGRDRRQLI